MAETRGFSDKTAIGKRLRRLSELIDRDAKSLYKEQGVQFEQRWFGVLNELVVNGPMTVKELAQALRITHASVSETRRSLEAANIIVATADKSDGRQRILHLTAKGKRLVDTLSPLWQALEDASIELNHEARNVVAALDRLDAALERQSLYERVARKLWGDV
ncbi:MarR family winged helix-turn-helix transcriptional regulator [Marinicaulis aureus]|uniref:MarR family winged helix-turn-helix transcriptional regulator n=1 Tax=Hyphococcus aureus TaxID=2666033 RepID=A0ABW1KUC4_9PROT